MLLGVVEEYPTYTERGEWNGAEAERFGFREREDGGRGRERARRYERQCNRRDGCKVGSETHEGRGEKEEREREREEGDIYFIHQRRA